MPFRASHPVIAGGMSPTKPYTPLIEEPGFYMYRYMENWSYIAKSERASSCLAVLRKVTLSRLTFGSS